MIPQLNATYFTSSILNSIAFFLMFYIICEYSLKQVIKNVNDGLLKKEELYKDLFHKKEKIKKNENIKKNIEKQMHLLMQERVNIHEKFYKDIQEKKKNIKKQTLQDMSRICYSFESNISKKEEIMNEILKQIECQNWNA